MQQTMPQLKLEKEKTMTVKVDHFTFILSAYCYEKVGMTENMKFRLKCKENPVHNREFDDIKEMTDYIGQFVFACAIDLVM